MNNELIPTNSLWYRIKKFFKKLFFKEKQSSTKDIKSFKNSTANNIITFNDNLKEKFEMENKKHVLAEKLLYGELNTSELEENEVDEITDYFTKDIKNIDNELLRIKQHILAMQKELKQE
ncbi:MAG TPA: hypothetical protein OIM45_08350 [Clostridiaceae bacterium]|nr:hypothetical protein [Clostridiaceae bacterium]